MLDAILMISKKLRNNSKIESGPSAKAAYGSCYKIDASLLCIFKNKQTNKKNKQELKGSALLQENFPEGGGGPRNPPACLVAAREGARPRIFWMFCRIDIVHRI